MIIDSHCHAWRYWPYVPAVPDPASRGTVEQLLFEMEQCGVDKAVLVSARLVHNADNNDYGAACRRRFPQRLYQFADVDCSWSATYQTPGAADRLTDALERYHAAGFTHYVKSDDDGSWYLSSEGADFFSAAAELGQIASLAIPARLQSVLRRIAERYPSVPFLCHHMAGARSDRPDVLPEILLSARLPNIFVKLSGFHYVGAVAWDYPYADCAATVRALYEHFGPDRLCWGSDYPVVRPAMTYRQSLEAVRTHCDFIPLEHRQRILGLNMQRLLHAQQ